MKEGNSAVLLQSSLDSQRWADPLECYCYPRIVQDLLADGRTPCERDDSGNPVQGSTKLARKSYQRIFVGRALHAGGTWKGDILVADIEELEKMDVLNSTQETQCKGSSNAPKWRNNFPIADGTVKLSGGDQVLRTSTPIWDHPNRGEEQGYLVGESDGSSSNLISRLISVCW